MDELVEEEQEIVIVGGGICGLATALALHRKGIKSVVLERSDTLRASGGAIGILANGWRALDQLGVASPLRLTSLPLQGAREILLDKGTQHELPLSGNGEARCLKRSDLIKTLADALPPGTIHFGCQIHSVKLDPFSSYPILQLIDGRSIVAKVVIGCDGAKSMVAEFLELKPTKQFTLSAVRGLTSYPNGHALPHEFIRFRRKNIFVGRVPLDDKSIYWFVVQHSTTMDARPSQNSEFIRWSALQSVDGFPTEIIKMIEDSDSESLSHSHLRYRAPWDLLLGKFRKGTVTVAGDAMHVMGPFLGQGGSAGMEDAIVLARCLSQKLSSSDLTKNESQMMLHEVGEAMDQYVKARRMRVVRLSTQTYLSGLLLQPGSSSLVKLACIVLMVIIFRSLNSHTGYDCGRL